MNIAAGLRNLRRLREIISVLVVDYGFGSVFDQLDLGGMLPVRRRRLGRLGGEMPAARARLSTPERLRLALGQLGPTFIKLGQVLSARADLLPPAYVAELRRLQDRAPEVPSEEIKQVVEAELGRPLDQAFAEFDPVPLSAASLGQVHGAVLKDGRRVTVKVLRPGVERVVEADLQILSDVAYLVSRQVPALQRYDLPGFVRRFASQLEDELIYTLEARNTDRMRDYAARSAVARPFGPRGEERGARGEGGEGREAARRSSVKAAGARVHVPEVVWELTTRRVLTLERVDGRRVDELSKQAVGFDRAATAGEFGRFMLRQIFLEGFFHGDPHQGNVLIADDGTILLLDFGIMGYLEPRSRELLSDLIRHAYREDVEGVVASLSDLGSLGPDTDLPALRAELSRIVSRFLAMPERQVAIGELLSSTLRALWVHQMRVPPEMATTAKALALTEALCSELDPGIDLRDLAKPVVEEAFARAFAPAALAERLLRGAEAALHRLGRLPGRLDRILSLLEGGGLRLRVEDPDADRRAAGLGRGLNRLALSVLAAALLISGALYLGSVRHAAHVGLGVAAVVSGIFLGLVVALAVLRPGRV
jgi:ubiquinone biosynthesis protein